MVVTSKAKSDICHSSTKWCHLAVSGHLRKWFSYLPIKSALLGTTTWSELRRMGAPHLSQKRWPDTWKNQNEYVKRNWQYSIKTSLLECPWQHWMAKEKKDLPARYGGLVYGRTLGPGATIPWTALCPGLPRGGPIWPNGKTFGLIGAGMPNIWGFCCSWPMYGLYGTWWTRFRAC